MVDISELLELELKPALGCTEPVAIGYASSLAYHAMLGKVPEWLKGRVPVKYLSGIKPDEVEIESIELFLDRGIFKNALAIAIPRSGGMKGINIAAAMGIFCFPQAEGQEMALFKTLNSEDLDKAMTLAEKVKPSLIEGWEESENIQIEAIVTARHKNDTKRVIRSIARIEDTHSNVISIDVQDSLGKISEVAAKKVKGEAEIVDPRSKLKNATISEIVAQVKELPMNAMERVVEMMEMNLFASEEGLKEKRGLGVGASLRELVDEGYLSDDLITSAQIMAASAADLRMGGFDYPIMSCAGSGNHGITASLPIIAVASKRGYAVRRLLVRRRNGQLSEEEEGKLKHLARAVALSSLLTCYVTYHSKYLSALCGCAVKAGLGAAAGIAYLLDGKEETVKMAIQNMAANITGIICDGAKEGCALKLMTSAAGAVESALLAMKGVKVPSDNGIVAEEAENTIKNIGRLCGAMVATDAEVVRIMAGKQSKENLPIAD